MSRIAILRAKNGTYKDKAGQEKTSYITVGSVIDGKNGRMYKLDSIPVNFDGWLYEGELPTQQSRNTLESGKQKNDHAGTNWESFDDKEIPF